MGLLAKALRKVRYGLAKTTTPVERAVVLRVELEQVTLPKLVAVEPTEIRFRCGLSASLQLLAVEQKPARVQLSRWTIKSDRVAFPCLLQPKNEEVGLPPTPRSKECLGWPVKPTGRIEYSEFRFFTAAVQDRFRPLNLPTVQEAQLQISVDAGSDPHITEL